MGAHSLSWISFGIYTSGTRTFTPEVGLGFAAHISSYETNDSRDENPPFINLSRKECCCGCCDGASSIRTSTVSGLLLLRSRELCSSVVGGRGGEEEEEEALRELIFQKVKLRLYDRVRNA